MKTLIFSSVLLLALGCNSSPKKEDKIVLVTNVDEENNEVKQVSFNTKPDAPKAMNDFERLIRISSSCRGEEEDKSIFVADTSKPKTTESTEEEGRYKGPNFTYQVPMGEDLEAVALKYNISATTLKKDNQLKTDEVEGTTLTIRLKSKYKGKSGDNLEQIASKFNTDLERLKTINNLSITDSLEGKSILIPF